MRVGSRHDQQGAVMAITAIAMVTLMAAAALSVDLGVGWATRRNLVTSTDAAALAAAQTFVGGGDGCAVTAPSYLGTNAPSSTMTLCTTGSSGTADGTVTVSAEQNVDVYFGKVVGMAPYIASSSTTVRWGPPAGATGLRPIGLCADGIQGFLNDPTTTATYEISYNDQGSSSGQIDFCGNGQPEGNWGIVDFDNNGNSNAEIKDQLANGYPNPVYSGTIGGNCTNEAYACYEGNTGQGLTNAYKTELANLRDNNIYFGVPIFDFFTDLPGGNLELHLVGFARVRIIAYKLTGATRSITLEFSPGLITGECCNPGGPPTNTQSLEICAVKENDLSGC
ncbi:MAG: hypothetical protein HKN03_14685 [Acidimicrobiales bacterium]|nr:hypothetical protein [Acidimicrobiales bacterium]